MREGTQRATQKVPGGVDNVARFLPAKEVAALVQYTPDYVTRLAREGKVVAEKRGQQWFVSADSLKLFSLQQAAEQRERQNNLREQRLREYAATQRATKITPADVPFTTHALPALLASGVVAVCFALAGLLGWTMVDTQLQLAQLNRGGVDVPPAFVISTRVVPKATETYAPSSAEVRIVDGELVVGEGVLVNDVFSDSVVVTEVATTSAIITPVFGADAGTPYRLEIIPVRSHSNL
jgi:hypothetical protein